MTIGDEEGAQATGYHAHVYYEPQTREAAEFVREGLALRFSVQLGRWHDQPVGPHTLAMYQVLFEADQFGAVVPWLMLHRRGLDVLIHPATGDDLADHTRHALWLGKPLPLRLEALAN